MRFQAVQEYREKYPIAWMCRHLRVSTSGYYAWQRRPECDRQRRDEQLTLLVRSVHAESRQTYGSPRVYQELKRRGQRVGRKRVARLMRQESLQGLRKRRFVRTTDSKHKMPVAGNIVARDFSPEVINKTWAGDITYLRSDEGWLYLATVIDLYSRRIVGWCIDDNMRSGLVIRALDMAVGQRCPSAGLVFHSDRGSQYASEDFQAILKKHGIVCSMSRKAECWDNAVAESFFGRLKDELLYRHGWTTKRGLRDAVAEYITCFYNSSRSHSTLGYMSPMEYEAAHQSNALAA
jgi:putative transposase